MVGKEGLEFVILLQKEVTMAEMENSILLGIISLIIIILSGGITMIFRYISKLKEKVQFKDVCEATHQGLNETLDAKFKGMHELMKTRFDSLEKLVKENGNG